MPASSVRLIWRTSCSRSARRQQPCCDLRTGHISSTLCHLGNIAYRVGHEVRFDAEHRQLPRRPGRQCTALPRVARRLGTPHRLNFTRRAGDVSPPMVQRSEDGDPKSENSDPTSDLRPLSSDLRPLTSVRGLTFPAHQITPGRDAMTDRTPNRLIDETSPYLLQHAYNPVDWHPWGDEAFTLAAEQDKPVFLSVGYSACHWCHVMEHESFENAEIAGLMNRVVRLHQGRSRRASRRRSDLHVGRPVDDAARRLADVGVSHARQTSVLRRHLLAPYRPHGDAGVCRHPGEDSRDLDRSGGTK